MGRIEEEIVTIKEQTQTNNNTNISNNNTDNYIITNNTNNNNSVDSLESSNPSVGREKVTILNDRRRTT